jgi:hypothetical protein
MDSVPDMPDPQTRTAVTQRITAHVTRGWPTSASPSCATADGTATSLPSCPATASLRLRYQGSADCWATGIYLASSGQYTESGLPASSGPKTGTPEEGVDDTFVLYAGPESGH